MRQYRKDDSKFYMEIQRMKNRQNDHEKNKVGRVMLPGFKAYSYSNSYSIYYMFIIVTVIVTVIKTL